MTLLRPDTPGYEQGNTIQRVRDELCRAYGARTVASPARPLGPVYRLDYWTGLARLLESGKFDGLFLADVLGPYDVYQGSADAAIRSGIQIPVNDPLLLVSGMAAVTEHLGFQDPWF
jgi:alkanesulfonate monooxygenase SsuD/methylene tetrahydromethanopterin reductase-like flavin-dependent oxidoreductase (luciferase family)